MKSATRTKTSKSTKKRPTKPLQRIKITIQGNGSKLRRVKVKAKLTTKFQDVKKHYAKVLDIPSNHLVFQYNGKQLGPNDTPQSIGLKERDFIKAQWSIMASEEADLVLQMFQCQL